MRDVVPGNRREHVRHWIFRRIPKERERLQNVQAVIPGLYILSGEPAEDALQAEALARYVEIDEVALRAPARDRAHLHTGDIAGVGHLNFEESSWGEEHRIGIAEKAHLGPLDHRMNCARRFCDKRKVGHGLHAREETLFVEQVRDEEVQIYR